MTMLRFVLLTISLSLSLSACDEAAPLANTDDVSFRPAPWGLRFDTSHLGQPLLQELNVDKASYNLVEVKGPFLFKLIGDKAHAYAHLDDLVGAELKLKAEHKGKLVVADAEVIDIVEKVPTALIIDIPDPTLELCDIVDGILILASAGECPE